MVSARSRDAFLRVLFDIGLAFVAPDGSDKSSEHVFELSITMLRE